ncbi:TetR/AcrR family transcriptional regulator [Kineococcus sp. NPDC059986]|uniref:TetR/AcrR family transcriptional regulator n=1 Tax=Kineococcus sp. NPDC059986 TaxID=3155538 RepID=UPI00344E8CA8
MPITTEDVDRGGVRLRLIRVAASLLADQGSAAVTTRAVAQAAGMQAPAIYRLFGDKDGLLEAVAEHVMDTYVAEKSAHVEATESDPVEDLHAGWRAHVEFGLANPALFRFLHDPERAAASPATEAGLEVLRTRVHRVAAAGRLRVAEPRAVAMVHAAGTGAVTTLLAAADSDLGLAEALWEAVSRAILTDAAPVEDGVARTVAFRATVDVLPGLTGCERSLMVEWLDRAIVATDA